MYNGLNPRVPSRSTTSEPLVKFQMIYKQFYQEFTETVDCLKVRYMGACIAPAWKSSSWEYNLNILQLFLTRLNLKKGITRDWESKLVRINCISLSEFHEKVASIRIWILNCNGANSKSKNHIKQSYCIFISQLHWSLIEFLSQKQ